MSHSPNLLLTALPPSPILHGVISTGTSVLDVEDEPMGGNGTQELKELFGMAHENTPLSIGNDTPSERNEPLMAHLKPYEQIFLNGNNDKFPLSATFF